MTPETHLAFLIGEIVIDVPIWLFAEVGRKNYISIILNFYYVTSNSRNQSEPILFTLANIYLFPGKYMVVSLGMNITLIPNVRPKISICVKVKHDAESWQKMARIFGSFNNPSESLLVYASTELKFAVSK